MKRFEIEYLNSKGETITKRFRTEGEARDFAALVNLVLHCEVTIYQLVG